MFITFFLMHHLIYRVLCQKKLLKTSVFRKRLRIDQETLQISVFASMFFSLVKKTCCKENTFFLLYCSMCRALYERESEPPKSQSMSKEKSRNIANTVFSLILLNLVKNVSYFQFITLSFIEHV